jgi:hypothetical protein
MAEATALAVATPNLFQTVNPATGETGPAYQGRTVDQALSKHPVGSPVAIRRRQE